MRKDFLQEDHPHDRRPAAAQLPEPPARSERPAGQREIAPMAHPMKENRPRLRLVNFFDLCLVNQR